MNTPNPHRVTQDVNGNLTSDVKRVVETLIEERNQMTKEGYQIAKERVQNVQRWGSNDEGKVQNGQKEGKCQDTQPQISNVW